MTWTLPEFPHITLPDWLSEVTEEPDANHPLFLWSGPPDVWVVVDDIPGSPIVHSIVLNGVWCTDGDKEWDDVFVIETFDPELARLGYEQAIRLAKEYGCDIPEGWMDRVPLYNRDGIPRQGSGLLPLGPKTIQPATARALEMINRHRADIGMGPLDVRAAGWTEQDVVDEAQRIARLTNPLEDLKHRLI
jgi:hypothetical protein